MMNYVKEYKKLKKKPPSTASIAGLSAMLEADKIYKDLIHRGVIEKAEPLVIARGNPVVCITQND